MSKVVQFENRDQIEERACEWIAKLDRGLSLCESDNLNQWLQQDRRHREALLEMATLLDNMAALSRLAELFPLDSGAVCRTPDSEGSGKGWFAPLIPRFAFVAMCFLAVSIGYQYNFRDQADLLTTASTTIGEAKVIKLDDGSAVTLNTYSKINVFFNEQQRKIVLQRGEALFDVAHDSNRPFLVVAGDTTIRAVGTAFNVELSDRTIEVTVTDGIVDIETATSVANRSILDQSTEPAASLFVEKGSVDGEGAVAGEKPATRMRAGQMAIIAQQLESLQPIDPATIKKKLSWQQGIIVFEGETLEQVVAEISRYTTKTFLISDDATRSIRIGGYFEIGDVEQMLDILQNGFNIEVTHNHSGVIYLSSLNNKTRNIDVP